MVDLKKVREVKPIVSDSISDAAGQIVLDGVDAGFDFDEIAPETGPKIRAESKFSQNGLDELTKILSLANSTIVEVLPIPDSPTTSTDTGPLPFCCRYLLFSMM